MTPADPLVVPGAETPGQPAMTPLHEKPLVVQLWLRGAITSEYAILLALCGDDPAAKMWALHLASMQVVDPKSFVSVTNV